MRVHASTRFATLAALVGALACASNTARTDDPDESAAARDTTTEQDTLTGQNENPPGYRGMERDTTQVPEQTPSDTFLQNQGQGTPQDTAGYSGMERVDTTGGQQQGQTDTTGFGQPGQTDTTGIGQTDTTSMGGDTTGVSGGQDTSGMTGADTSGMSETGDTTGYDQTQQSRDSTNR
jgi:hypothetical protein